MALLEASGSVIGSSVVSAIPSRTILFSARVEGLGELIDGTLLLASGSVEGACSVTGQFSVIRSVAGVFEGVGRAWVSLPDPVRGRSSVSGFAEVSSGISYTQHQCPPYFRLGHEFQRGDIVLSITDGLGNPCGPALVTYALYKVLGQSLHRVGPGDRIPVESSVGRYYITGTAGEGDQPGLWLARFRYQQSFGSAIQERDLLFRVVDSALKPLPGDNLERKNTYGWN